MRYYSRILEDSATSTEIIYLLAAPDEGNGHLYLQKEGSPWMYFGEVRLPDMSQITYDLVDDIGPLQFDDKIPKVIPEGMEKFSEMAVHALEVELGTASAPSPSAKPKEPVTPAKKDTEGGLHWGIILGACMGVYLALN